MMHNSHNSSIRILICDPMKHICVYILLAIWKDDVQLQYIWLELEQQTTLLIASSTPACLYGKSRPRRWPVCAS